MTLNVSIGSEPSVPLYAHSPQPLPLVYILYFNPTTHTHNHIDTPTDAQHTTNTATNFTHTGSDVDIAGSSSENDEARLNNINKKHGASPFGRRHFPRDSGCYEGSPLPSSQTPTQAVNSTDESNSLDDVVSKCSSEIMKRVESARRCKDNPFKATLPARVGKKSFLGGGGVGCGGLMADDTLTRGGLSEKSSDSGVSSSSLSSGPLKSST